LHRDVAPGVTVVADSVDHEAVRPGFKEGKGETFRHDG
jgi:hypothetical protein